MNQDTKSIVSVIDADFIPFYVCHNKKDYPEKSLDDCIRLTNEFIFNINNTIKADYYVGFLTISKCFRYDINPNYKVNRKYDNLPTYINEVKEHLIDLGFKGQKGWEADDLVVSFKAQNSQYESVLVSPDKDILNLEGNHFNPRKMVFKSTSKSEAEEYFWKSMICGDTIDGIKGIPGKGEKFFETVINVDCFLEDKDILKNKALRKRVFEAYIKELGEYEGIKEFTKNYLSLKIVDNIELEEIKLNKVEQITFV